MVGKILEHDTYAYGFDAQTGEFGNLITKGIIDPTTPKSEPSTEASAFARQSLEPWHMPPSREQSPRRSYAIAFPL